MQRSLSNRSQEGVLERGEKCGAVWTIGGRLLLPSHPPRYKHRAWWTLVAIHVGRRDARHRGIPHTTRHLGSSELTEDSTRTTHEGSPFPAAFSLSSVHARSPPAASFFRAKLEGKRGKKKGKKKKKRREKASSGSSRMEGEGWRKGREEEEIV